MTGICRRQSAAIWIVSLSAIISQSAIAAPPTYVPGTQFGQSVPPQRIQLQQAAAPIQGMSPSAMTASIIPSTGAATSVVTPASYGCDAPGIDMGVATAGGCDTGCSPIWASFEYLLWWSDEGSLPGLVTTSPVGTSRDNAGVLGFDTTSVLFGGSGDTENESQSGFRATIGLWLDSGQSQGIFGRWFTVDGNDLQFNQSSDGSTILGRPFFNTLTNEQDALLMGFPNEISGDVNASYSSETTGFEVLMRHLWRAQCNYRLDFVYGYRHLSVDDTLRVDNFLEFIDPAANTLGTTIDQRDRFEVENEFHGGEFGIMGHSVDGRFTMDFLATLSLGTMSERAAISGSTTTTPANGDPFNAEGGLLTQTSNIGVFEDDSFTVLPELTVSLGYLVTPRMDLSVGYTLLYVDNIMRAGDIVDTSVNLNQQTGVVGGAARPAFQVADGSYWLQGLNFGLNFRY